MQHNPLYPKICSNNRGFPKVDHLGIDARIVLEQNNFNNKKLPGLKARKRSFHRCLSVQRGEGCRSLSENPPPPPDTLPDRYPLDSDPPPIQKSPPHI